MYIRVTLSYVISFAVLLSTVPAVTAQQTLRSCRISLTEGQAQLNKVQNLKVSVTRRDISESFPDYPKGHPLMYQFSLEGKTAASVMKSPKLMVSISRNIIHNCGSVGAVSFGVVNTGWIRTVGLLGDGKIDIFECAEDLGIYPGRNNTGQHPTWGMEYCTI